MKESLIELSNQFWEKGYIILEEYFDSDLMDEYNEMILNHYGHNPDWEHSNDFVSRSGAEVVPWFPYLDGNTRFNTINDDPFLNDLTTAIIGEDWANLYCMCMFSKKGSKGQAWHQDCPPENPDIFNLNRLVYTHDITTEIGGELCVMEGTHKKGLLPAGIPNEDLEGQKEFLPKKGTVVLLHGHCWHKVKKVKGDWRVSTNFRAVPSGVPEDVTDICVYRNMRYRFSTEEVVEERYVEVE
ncbi:MAG: phytanoyl-CoA dioxygenase family protein [Gracilimonas sp.]|jgi:hypothetical protein|nr:phytanoyl-CoA dioxygenase family protein [Gracilimonas sp.]